MAFLERVGFRPAAFDLALEAVERLTRADDPGPVGLVAISVPMHTALHIGVREGARLFRCGAPPAAASATRSAATLARVRVVRIVLRANLLVRSALRRDSS
jgi:hypothetical protein